MAVNNIIKRIQNIMSQDAGIIFYCFLANFGILIVVP